MKATWLLNEIVVMRYKFDAGQLTGVLRKKYGPLAYKDINKKKISNKLNRLHCMGFVERERVKRQVIARDGNICNRGFKYLYWINKQGSKYVRYLSSASARQIQQMHEESRAKRDKEMRFLTMLARISQLQISNTQLQNELWKIQEGKTFGVSNTEWIRLAKETIRENQETIKQYQEALSTASLLIKLQEEKISELTNYIKRNSSNALQERSQDGKQQFEAR